jgi:hypothetical protein
MTVSFIIYEVHDIYVLPSANLFLERNLSKTFIDTCLLFSNLMLVIMRSFLFLATIAPLVIACDNPDNDACASAFTVSSADAATFCATYTTVLETETTDLPAYATYCSMKPKKLSSACSCLVAPTTLQTATAVATSGVGLQNVHGRDHSLI